MNALRYERRLFEVYVFPSKRQRQIGVQTFVLISDSNGQRFAFLLFAFS